MKKYSGILSYIFLSLGILLALNHYLIPISYLSPAFFAKVKPTLLPEGYYNQRACSSLKSYLKNKRVAIVGPAASFEGSKYGSEIDAHDIVIRVNSGVWQDEDFKRDFGSRMDVLFSNFNSINQAFMRTYLNSWKDADFLVAMDHFAGDIYDNFFSENLTAKAILGQAFKTKMTFCNLSDDFFQDFKSRHIKYANTGVATLAFLITTSLKSLSIYGFDFYQSGYHRWMEKDVMPFFQKKTFESLRTLIKQSSKVHNQEVHTVFFNKHILSDKRVTLYRPK